MEEIAPALSLPKTLSRIEREAGAAGLAVLVGGGCSLSAVVSSGMSELGLTEFPTFDFKLTS